MAEILKREITHPAQTGTTKLELQLFSPILIMYWRSPVWSEVARTASDINW